MQPVRFFSSLFQLHTRMKSSQVPAAVSLRETLRDFTLVCAILYLCAPVWLTSCIQSLHEGEREDGFPGRKVL